MGYLDNYQSSNRKLKFCFYILVDNGLNVLPLTKKLVRFYRELAVS